MSEFSLVPVDHQPDFGDVSFVPVDHDPFSENGAEDRFHQANAQSASQPQQTLPYNNPEGDAAAMSPETYVNPLVKRRLGDLLTLPQRAIDASATDVQHFGEDGYIPQSIGPAVETAITMAGTGSLIAERGAAGALGGKLPMSDSGVSVADKLDRYLLNPDHADGGTKANWFKQALGFTRENASDLAKQLVFDESQAVRKGVNEYGTVFNQTINVTGANGRTIPVITGWTIGPDGVPRLNTAFPSR